MEFVISALGLVFAYRIFVLWDQRKIQSRENIQKCFLFFGLFHLTVTVCLNGQFFSLWIFILLELLTLFCLPLGLESYRRASFHSQSVCYLDLLILAMKAGKSFRDALISTKNAGQKLGFFFHELTDAHLQRADPKVFAKNPEVLRLFTQLAAIERENHRIIDRLSALRFALRSELWMRAKVNQALMQTRMQSLVMTLLYVFLIGISYQLNGLGRFPRLFAVSLVMYSVGTVLLFQLGKRYKWKI